MNRFGKWLFVVGILFVAGCVTVGRDFNQHATLQIEANETTQGDIQELLGSPHERGLEGGYVTWTYRYIEKVIFETERHKELKVYFKRDGTVHTTAYNTSNAEWEVTP